MTSVTLNIPVVETERLILRGHRVEDLDAMVEFFAGDRNTYVGGKMERGDCWRAMLRGMGHWAMRGYGLWHIDEKSSGSFVGWTGMIFAPGWDEPELGWSLLEGAEGKGYAFEAATAARSHAAQHQGMNGVISYIAHANNRSMALAERLGAKFEREGALHGKRCQVWRHPRLEVQA